MGKYRNALAEYIAKNIEIGDVPGKVGTLKSSPGGEPQIWLDDGPCKEQQDRLPAIDREEGPA